MLNFISPRGRLGRGPYALAMLVVLLLLAATVAVPALGWVQAGRSSPIQWSVRPGLVPAVLLLWPLACLQINRLRDAGLALWWALAPVAVLVAALAFVQLHDGLDIIAIGYLQGADSLRRTMVWAFLESHLAMAWATLACLGGLGWLIAAPSRRPAEA